MQVSERLGGGGGGGNNGRNRTKELTLALLSQP